MYFSTITRLITALFAQHPFNSSITHKTGQRYCFYDIFKNYVLKKVMDTIIKTPQHRTKPTLGALIRDAHFCILSFLSLKDLIRFIALSKKTLTSVKYLLSLKEQRLPIPKAQSTAEDQHQNLAYWLYTQIKTQKNRPLTITPLTHRNIILDNGFQIFQFKDPYSEPTTRTRNQNITGFSREHELFCNSHNRISIHSRNGATQGQHTVDLDKTALRSWQKENNVDIQQILSTESKSSFVILSTSGDVYGVGHNSKGKFAPHEKRVTIPKKLPFPHDISIKKIAVSAESLAFIDQKGNVYTTGAINSFLANTLNHRATNAMPRKMTSNERFIEVAVSDNHLLALSDKYEVWVLGCNRNNQLGLDPTISKDADEAVQPWHTRDIVQKIDLTPHLREGDKPIKLVTASYSSFMITEQGDVLGCGNNFAYTLGLEENDSIYPITCLQHRDHRKSIKQVITNHSKRGESAFTMLITNTRALLWSGMWKGKEGRNSIEQKGFTELTHDHFTTRLNSQTLQSKLPKQHKRHKPSKNKPSS